PFLAVRRSAPYCLPNALLRLGDEGVVENEPLVAGGLEKRSVGPPRNGHENRWVDRLEHLAFHRGRDESVGGLKDLLFDSTALGVEVGAVVVLLQELQDHRIFFGERTRLPPELVEHLAGWPAEVEAHDESCA